MSLCNFVYIESFKFKHISVFTSLILLILKSARACAHARNRLQTVCQEQPGGNYEILIFGI